MKRILCIVMLLLCLSGCGVTEIRDPGRENDTWTPTETTADPARDVPGNYVLNTSSHKYHDPSCDSVEEMSPKNRQDYYGTPADLESQGYTPCSRCQG